MPISLTPMPISLTPPSSSPSHGLPIVPDWSTAPAPIVSPLPVPITPPSSSPSHGLPIVPDWSPAPAPIVRPLPGPTPTPTPLNQNFWTATRAEGLTNADGSFNRDLYSHKSHISQVNSRATLPTWVDMRNKSLDSKYAEYTFGSGSDRLILDDKTSNQAQKRIFMGEGHDDVTHTGTQGINQASFDLGSGHDRIGAHSATNAHFVLGNGNDELNIRELKGGNQIEGGAGRDVYRLAKFTGNNSITDTEGVSNVDFTQWLKDSNGRVITSQGFPIQQDLFGQWFFTTIEGRNSGTKPVPGKDGPSVNSFNFTRGQTTGDYKLINKEGDALEMRFGDVLGNKISFADGSIQQNPKTGVWTKTVRVPQPPVLYGAPRTASALAAPASDVVKTYQLDDKGAWKEIKNS